MGTKKFILPFLGVFLAFAPHAFAAVIDEQLDNSTQFQLDNTSQPTDANQIVATWTASSDVDWSSGTYYGAFYIQNMDGRCTGSYPDFDACSFRITDITQSADIFVHHLTSTERDAVNAGMTFISSSMTPVGGGTPNIVAGDTLAIRFETNGRFNSENPLDTLGTSGGNGYFVFATSAITPGPPPPTSEFNQVTFLPSQALNISTSTVTVGASYSLTDISSTTIGDYIGYRIFAPNGDIVYDATTTPSVPGTYTITTDFDFTDNGLYSASAYYHGLVFGYPSDVDFGFARQQIQVNNPQYVVGSDGNFSSPAVITATSTLSGFNIDCGTGDDSFLSGIIVGFCNVAVNLFVPSASSIQSIQSSFNNVTTKSPFNFFTESHAVLGALNGTVGVQQSLAVNLFGKNMDVISTSTASSIGLNSTLIDYLKFLMTTGLWILFAWFLYWRIASIFGV
jgi:hypothetical protein